MRKVWYNKLPSNKYKNIDCYVLKRSKKKYIFSSLFLYIFKLNETHVLNSVLCKIGYKHIDC